MLQTPRSPIKRNPRSRGISHYRQTNYRRSPLERQTPGHELRTYSDYRRRGDAAIWAVSFVFLLAQSSAGTQPARAEQLATPEQLATVTKLQQDTQAKMDLYRSSGTITIDGEETALRLGRPEVRQVSFEKRGDTILYSDEHENYLVVYGGQPENTARLNETPLKRRYLRTEEGLYSWPFMDKPEAYEYVLEDWKDVPRRQNAMRSLIEEMRAGDPVWYAFMHMHMPLREVFDRVAAQAGGPGQTGFSIQGNPDKDAEVTLQCIDEEGRTLLRIVLDMQKGGVLSRAVSQRYDGSEAVYEYVDEREYVELSGAWYPSRSVQKRTERTKDGTSTRVVEVLLDIERVQQSTPLTLADLDLTEGAYVNRNKPNGQCDRFRLKGGQLVPVGKPKQP